MDALGWRSGLDQPISGGRRARLSSSSPRRGFHVAWTPAPVAQRIEHLTTDQKVWGSNPYGRATHQLTSSSHSAPEQRDRRLSGVPHDSERAHGLLANGRTPGRVRRGRTRRREEEGVPSKSADVQNEKQYDALNHKGTSKERAARIANSPDASQQGGRKSGSGGDSRHGGTTAQKKKAGRKRGKAA